MSIEMRKKMSEERIGEKNPNFGKKHSIEIRRKMAYSLIGKNIGKDNHMFGKKHTKEAQQKMKKAWERRRLELGL
jgi:hypothetical protein